MPKVSIIMGVLNAEKRIQTVIENIKNQTILDWELIICDDGSIDNTYKIIQQIIESEPRVILLRNEKNMGLAFSLNKCLEKATSDYVARMDDDDFCYPERFEKQIYFLEHNFEYAFVSSQIELYDGFKVLGIQKVIEKPEKYSFLWGSPFVHPATMFRREALINVNGYRVANETKRREDFDLFMRMYSLGSKGYNIQEPLLKYYINLETIKRKNPYKHNIDEAIVRYKGYKQLGILPVGIVYIFKPLIVGMIPKSILFLSLIHI